MARLYSGRKGKSGSKKPIKKVKQGWIRYSDKEVEQLVIKLTKQGYSQSKLGVALRDTYGVPDVKVLTGKSVSTIIKENKLNSEIPEDLLNLIKRETMIHKHLGANKKDKTALRGLQLTESKIKRLVKYYKTTGQLSSAWNYNREQAKLLTS
ncbi:30S ribosomal protein S15 [Candidatus Woesearchaeota archaeon]|nr:30S ribosomal protein S15 [Candidatus Woesearchaeota archaeon]